MSESTTSNLPSRMIDFTRLEPSTPVIIEAGEETLSLSTECVIKFLAPEAPLAEALKFLLTCRAARINPFLGEAFLLPMGKKVTRWQTVISKSAYLRRAQQWPEYDGFESGIVVVVQIPDQKTGRSTSKVVDIEGTIMPPNALLVGGWCKVWKKGISRPFTKRVSMTEYDRQSGTWLSIPCTMIEKVAVASGHREAFGIGDSYEEAEIEVAYRNTLDSPSPVDRVKIASSTQAAQAVLAEMERESHTFNPSVSLPSPVPDRPDWAYELERLMDELGMSTEDRTSVLERRGVARVDDLPLAEVESLRCRMEQRLWATKAISAAEPSEPPVVQAAEATILPEVARPTKDDLRPAAEVLPTTEVVDLPEAAEPPSES